MDKLDPEVKKKWVADLRSGEFKQGKNWLRSKIRVVKEGGHEGPGEGDLVDGYCCMGVLAHQLGRLDESGAFVSKSGWKNKSILAGDSATTQRELLSESVQMRLACMNDGAYHTGMHNEGLPQKSYSFAEIADFIEKSEDI